MIYIEAISQIQLELKRRVKNKEVAEKLGVSRQYINNIENDSEKGKELSSAFKERLEVAFGVTLTGDSSPFHTRNDRFEIKYWEGCDEFGSWMKCSDLRSSWFEKEITRKRWHLEENNLRCFRIFNDKMDAGLYPFSENDLAFLNIADTDYSDGGVYLFTTEVNGVKNIFFSFVEPTLDGKLALYYAKTPEKRKVLTQEQLQEYKLTIIGRVIKNITKMI